MTQASTPEETPFQRKLREKRERDAAVQATQPQHAAEPADELVPKAPKRLSTEDQQLDAILADVDVLTAYQKWCGKMPIPQSANRQTESIKLSCPNPAHPDKHPSAWFNTDKGVWNCGACNIGGDKHEIAALRYGYPVPSYRSPGNTQFREVRQRMAADLGYTRRESGGTSYYEAPSSTAVENPVENSADVESDKSGQFDLPPSSGATNPDNGDVPGQTRLAAEQGSTAPDVTPDNVVELYEGTEPIIFPEIDWRAIVDPDTFLWEYLTVTSEDTCPEEYHFWNGMVALGLAVGRDITLIDEFPVLANLFVCLVGNTGDGKSRSKRHLGNLLNRALPYDYKAAVSKGVKPINSPASAEFLIKEFSKPLLDHDGKPTGLQVPIRGLVEYPELSGLSGRAARTGNVLKSHLMEFYDGNEIVKTGSMTHGSVEAYMPFCSTWSSTQPRALRDLVDRGDAASGWLNRWIFAGGKRKKRMAIGGVKIDITSAVPYLTKIHAWSGKPRELKMDSEARSMWEAFFDNVVEPVQDRDDTELLTRVDLLLKKLMLLFAINRKQDYISVDLVVKAIALHRYIMACYAIASDAMVNTLPNEVRAEIKRHIVRLTKKDGSGPSIRDINRCIARKNYPQKMVLDVLKFMQEMGEIEKVEVPAGKVGRPTVRYRFVD